MPNKPANTHITDTERLLEGFIFSINDYFTPVLSVVHKVIRQYQFPQLLDNSDSGLQRTQQVTSYL